MKLKRKAQTLIEVTVAALIAAATTMATFSVILSSFVSQKRSDKREAAGFVLKQAQETLKSYVSAVPAESDYVPNSGSGIGGDTSAWALSEGPHYINGLLDGTLLEGGTLEYSVTNNNCLGLGAGPFVGVTADDTNQCKEVVFTLEYPD